MDGFEVHGVRETQTLPANGGGKPVVITDEYWYSDYLHINVVMKHIDPRTGSVTMAHIAARGNESWRAHTPANPAARKRKTSVVLRSKFSPDQA